MNRTKSAVTLASAISFSLIAACGGGVKTSGAEASPTPHQTSTPGGTPTPSSSGTPTATPTGTPSADTMTCSFVWLTYYPAPDDDYDVYEVDVTSSKWANTTNAFLADMSVVGYYISGLDVNTGDIKYDAGMSIDGAIALAVSGMNMGDAAGFTDTESHTFYDAKDYFLGNSTTLGGAIADGGTGDFTGNLSDPDPTAAATAGDGSIAINDGFDFTIGGPSSDTTLDYAQCVANP